MKRIIVLIALSLVIIISITSITSITAISFEQNQYEDENSIIENETLDGNSKALIEQFYNDKSLSTQDKEEMKALFDMPQLFNSSNETKMADSSLKSNRSEIKARNRDFQSVWPFRYLFRREHPEVEADRGVMRPKRQRQCFKLKF